MHGLNNDMRFVRRFDDDTYSLLNTSGSCTVLHDYGVVSVLQANAPYMCLQANAPYMCQNLDKRYYLCEIRFYESNKWHFDYMAVTSCK